MLICSVHGFGQYYLDEPTISFKVHAGYAHDFPGLNGVVGGVEVNRVLSERLEGGFGVKRYALSGNPRTHIVNEYTKATTLDFNLYFVALNAEAHRLKVGAGYTFAFYNIRRSYPVIHGAGNSNTVEWPLADRKSRTSGITISGEYEYRAPGSNISVGLKGMLGKAFDQVSSVGPFISLHL